MNKPPFELNEEILNLVAKITEKLIRLEISIDKKKDLFLRKSSKIKSVNSSCAIEANNLCEDEVISIISGKTVLAPQKEIDEVKNAYNAYINITNYEPYEVDSFLVAHKTLTTDLIDESGKFRSNDVAVFDGKEVIHMGARPEYVSHLINELFDWAKESDLNPLIKSSIIHFEIEFIHPFADGNGRIGRFWQSLILCKYNSVFEYLPIETLVYEHQQQYYEALRKAEKNASSTAFIEFMLDMILQTIEKFDTNNLISRIKERYIKELSKTEQDILMNLIMYFEKEESINNEIAVSLLNKSKVNMRKYFSKFTKINILIPTGDNKGRKYSINKDIYK